MRALALTSLAVASLTAPLGACWSRSPARSPESAADAPGERLVAAREHGIFELARDGRELRKLSSTRANALRWLVPQARLLILTEETGELRTLELATGAERVVARVRTTLACPAAAADDDPNSGQVGLEVQDDWDFSAGPTHACLALMDRNANMASLRMEVRVDLTTGTSTEYLTIAAPECKLPEQEAPPCARDADFASQVPAADAGAEPPLEHAGPPGFEVASWSPSRRWVLLRGNQSELDYIHFQVVLYEVATRRTFPILGSAVAALGGARWPAPLTAAQLALDPEELAQLAGSAIGETPIYWLAGRDDRLVVAESLVLPGARVLQVGRLAR